VSRSDTPVVAPVYLPWPSVAGPVQQQPLPGSATSLVELLSLDPENPATILFWARRVLRSPAGEALGEDNGPLLFAQLMPAIELARITGLTRGCSYNNEQLLGYPPYPALECNIGGLVRAQAAFAQTAGFLVYRQSRATEGAESDWQQVSPLIEYAHWDALEVDPLNKEAPTARLNDPFVKILRAEGEPDTWRFMFFDRYPYVLPLFGDRAEYRYQLVYFDERHSPVAWRRSEWIAVGGS
jgi:hypothetical protein